MKGNKMKKIILSIFILAVFILPVSADTIRMGTEGAYPPYNFINDNGEIDGFERDLGDELCARAKLDCEWVQNDWDSIIPNLVSGNYDTIIAGMSITDERDEVIDFTQDYLPPDPSSYITLSSGNKAAYIGVVAAQTATIQASHVAASGAILVEFSTPDETISALKNGEVDAVMADKAFLKPIVAESNNEIKFIAKDVYIGGGVGMGIRESDTSLKDTFNAAIDSMKADGSLNALIDKWEGISEGRY
tara:strand:- start:29463 stop:30203 length:741 start_codon:yes stop_codon:yes gene_type:complete